MAAALAVGLWVARSRQGTISDVITRPAPEYGPAAQVLLPGLEGARVVVPDRPHTPEELTRGQISRTRTFTVRTNTLGLRGPEVVLPAPGTRILAVGDSVTFGWGVEEGQSWPAQLALQLGVEVLNAGVPAQRPPSIAAWTAANAPGLDVDLILFARRPDPREADPIGAYKAAIAQIRAALPATALGVILPPVSTFDPDGSARAEEERQALAAALSPTPVLDLTAAFRAALPRPGVILEISEGQQRILRLPGREALLSAPAPARGLAPEVLAAFEEDETIAEPLFFDGGHPDAEGFAIFAEAVARWVREERLLEGPRPPQTTGEAPIIPANAPEWERDPPPFVNDPAFYGEASWDDVRGRILQHQATVWRDRARLAAMGGDRKAAAERYAEGTRWLEAHPVSGGIGGELHRLYLEAMRRDARRVAALARGDADPWSPAASALNQDPATFSSFEDRHRLRVALVEAALNRVDLLRLPDRWGSWDPRDPEARPPARFTVEGLGALPTGDSWVDVAGEPGPAAIGRLEVLSLEDPAHRAWLEGEAARLQAALERDPASVRGALAQTLEHLDARPYTSRYYNLKQARNEAVRQLARAGRPDLAAALLDDAFPLHRQDLACPNRAGILRGIQGRLLGLAGDPRADAVMAEALRLGDAFLAEIEAVDRR